jgi:hypothetical protein
LPGAGVITAGSRDRSLAEAPELDYTSVAELLVLIDVLAAKDAGRNQPRHSHKR